MGTITGPPHGHHQMHVWCPSAHLMSMAHPRTCACGERLCKPDAGGARVPDGTFTSSNPACVRNAALSSAVCAMPIADLLRLGLR